jgi:Ni/Fe-hydrogenase subunit HybB-like protein
MTTNEQWIDANKRALERIPKLTIVFVVLIVLGVIGFAMGMNDTFKAYQAYWVNFIFFAGIAQGGVVLAAVYHVARGKWGGPMVRLGVMNVTFTLVTVILYLGIVFFAGDIFTWAKHPELAAGKEWWLNLPFLLIRNGIGLVLLAFFSAVFTYKLVRPEVGKLNELAGKEIYPSFFTKNWRGYEEEKERNTNFLRIWNPVMLFMFAIIYSMLGFDLIMSLEPVWFSTLFGAYFFVTCIYTGIATVVIISTLLRKPMHFEGLMPRDRFHDAGKLLFAFCILSTDFFWSQFLVIWYGDLPETNFFILDRTTENPWSTLSMLVLFMGFVIPFILLLAKKPKRMPLFLSTIAFIAMIGVFIERAVAILRSIYPEAGADFPVGSTEILVFLGFAGLYGLVMLWTMRRIPMVPEDSFAKTGH